MSPGPGTSCGPSDGQAPATSLVGFTGCHMPCSVFLTVSAEDATRVSLTPTSLLNTHDFLP